jgi:hypothetical protein
VPGVALVHEQDVIEGLAVYGAEGLIAYVAPPRADSAQSQNRPAHP